MKKIKEMPYAYNGMDVYCFNPKIELSNAIKKELSQIKSYDKNFKDSLVKLLSVNPTLESTRKNSMKNR